MHADAAQLVAILDLIQGLPAQTQDDVRVDAVGGEMELAIETLCTQLYEFDIKVSADAYAAIKEIGEAWGLEESNWTDLTIASD